MLWGWKIMAKKSKITKILSSLLCLILGVAIGFVSNLLFTMPDSYEIPKAVTSNSSTAVSGAVSAEVVNQSNLSIHFLELGNKYTGDCTLIKVGDTEMLIDAGSKASSIPYIKQYIDKYCTDGILEYVVVTHAHEDHYAGFATNENTDSLFDLYEVKNIIDFGNGTNKTTSNKMYANYIRERDAEVEAGASYHPAIDYINNVYPTTTQRFELGADSNVYVEMLYHKFLDGGTQASTENDYSVCLQIVYEEKYYLFTGDLEAEGEESLVENNSSTGKNAGMLHEVEVYKAGHHGSKTSSSLALLEVIKPKTVCVCCCAGSSEYTTKNENQFPTQIFINNVYTANANAKIYVTTLCTDYKSNKFESFNGNIVICAKSGENNTIYCSNNTTELKDTEWFRTNRTLPNVS